MWSLPALLIFFESTAAVNWWLPRDQGEAQSVCGVGEAGRETGTSPWEWELGRRSEAGSESWSPV